MKSDLLLFPEKFYDITHRFIGDFFHGDMSGTFVDAAIQHF